jgi:hypothetical protein
VVKIVQKRSFGGEDRPKRDFGDRPAREGGFGGDRRRKNDF